MIEVKGGTVVENGRGPLVIKIMLDRILKRKITSLLCFLSPFGVFLVILSSPLLFGFYFWLVGLFCLAVSLCSGFLVVVTGL